MKNTEEFFLDPSIGEYYALGQERDRLKQGNGCLEYDRTLNILKKILPPAPATVLDVGGAAGIYAFPLAEQGYEVHLIDPVPLHIEQAREYAREIKRDLASYSIGDARKIDKDDTCADAILYLGPLYHLIDRDDRLRALKEAYRILKPGGILIAAAISRFASFMDGVYRGLLLDVKYREIVKEDLTTGQHKSIGSKYFTTAYLHHPRELKQEIKECGFKNVSLSAVEGPVWHQLAMENLKKDSEVWQELLSILEKIENDESIIGSSAHIIATAKK